jgi:hypothetical protein
LLGCFLALLYTVFINLLGEKDDTDSD